MATLNGVRLKEGLAVEIYSRSQEKWTLGRITRINYSETFKTTMYSVKYDDNGWYKSLLEREVHLLLRLPPKKQQSDGQDEEKKLQDFCTQISDKLPLKKETVYKSLRTLLKEARNIDVHERVTWRGILEAVDQELYPKIATAMTMSVEELAEDRILEMTEFEPHVIDEVIRVLKLNKGDLLNKEVDYIKELIARAVRRNESLQITATDNNSSGPNHKNSGSFFRYKVLNDIDDSDTDSDLISNQKWKGLTANLVVDIYGIFKAMKYGAFRRENYSKNDFLADIEKAETNILKADAVSNFVEEIDIESAVSFHPQYVIKDDLFETVNPLLAMSLVLNKLESEQIGNGIKIKCVVVPALITSIYDETKQFESSIQSIAEYLRLKLPSDTLIVNNIVPATNGVPETAEILDEMIHIVLSRSSRSSKTTARSPSTIWMVFDRKEHGISSPTASVHVFTVRDRSAPNLSELDHNYFLGMEITVNSTSWQSFWETPSLSISRSKSQSTPPRQTHCWFRYGIGQRIRFVTEQLVWIIPILFARSSTMKPYDFWTRVYGDDYKHRWSISLKDSVLEKFHHILTGNILCSINYHREEVKVENVEFNGLRDHLEQTLGAVLMQKVMALFSDQRYDSDAVVEDVMVTEKERANSNDSNIYRHFNGLKSREWHQLKHGVMKYLRIECDANAKRDVADCPLIEEVIQNLIRFEQFGLEIDASNFYEFSLSALVKGLGHLYRVHEYALEENKHPIRHYVLEYVRCHLGAKCPVVQQHGDRKRENERRRADREKESKKEDDNDSDEIETQCEALRDTLCAAHCYLLHDNDELYRLRLAEAELRFATEVVGDGLEQKQDEMKNDDDDKKDDEETEEDPLSINYGESVLEWLSYDDSPRFESLREELLYNEDSTLDPDLLDRMIIQCAAAIEDSDFTLKEALALKTYADATAFQSELRKAHWKGLSMEVKTAYFRWAMTLYEAHLYHSQPIPAISGKPRGLFHGLNRMFTMHHELPVYLGPFSVSTNKTVAKQFSNEKGLLFTIAPSYANPFKFSIGIDMVTLSSFKNEAEVLFNNQPIPIKKTETFGDAMMRFVNHFLFSVKNRKTRINDAAAFWNKVGLEWNDEWIPFILNHRLLFAKTRFDGRKTIDRLFAELNIMNQRLVDPILDMKYDDGRPYLVHLLEDLKAKPLLQHYRLMTANFAIQKYFQNISRSFVSWRRNNSMNHVFGVTDVDDSCFDDAEYQINGKTVHRGSKSTGPILVIGAVRKVTVRSANFFGDRDIPIHEQIYMHEGAGRFSDDKRIRHDFGNLLKVDGYSNHCIFVDDIPSPNYEFQIDHEVKYNDNSVGKITRVLVDKVCVKVIKGSMSCFQWFESEEFPTQLTLNLDIQRSLSYDFSFAVVEGQEDQSSDLKPTKTHNFSYIEDFEIPCNDILAKKTDTAMTAFIGVYINGVDKFSDKGFWRCLKVIQYPPDNASNSLPNVHTMASNADRIENLMQNLKNCHFEITDDASYLTHFRLDQKRFSEWTAHITSHTRLFAVTAYRRRLIIERLIVELKLWSTEWIHRILEQKMKGKPMIQWLVEDRKLNQLHQHYRVFMSHFKVKHFQHLTFRWFEFEKNIKMKGKAGFSDFGDICFEETDYYFDGKQAPFNTPYFDGKISKISVKNNKLFGDQAVVIQNFDDNSGINIVGHDISECLKIDRYNNNNIFVDEVPPKDYRFRIGQSVKFNDGKNGVIAQLTADEICIKWNIGAANIYSFQWISRTAAPREVTFKFENQNNFSNFYFKTDIESTSSTTYYFSSIDQFSIPCREISENQSVWRTIRVSAKPRYGNYEWTQIREIDYSSNTDSALNIAPKSQVPIERLMTVLLDGDFEIREGERVLNELQLPNQREKEWLPLITAHPLFFAVTSYRRRLIIERLIVELKLWNTDWIHRILVEKRNDKPMLRWLVEDRKVVRLYDHYRVFMSFKVKSSALLHRRWLKYEKRTAMSGQRGFDDSDETCFQMTTYEADGESILPTTASVMSNVRQITARNDTLFGDEPVVLHKFQETPNREQLSDDFVNALKVDQYSNGSVFVDDIPSMQTGHAVRLNDGVQGTISRLLAEQMCVKINAEHSKMNSFRWISRLEATLIFQDQSDLNNYLFAVTLGNSDESAEFSSTERHQFSDVKNYMIPCPGLSGYQSGTAIIGVYAKPRDGDYQWAPIKAIKYPSSNELAEALRSQSENASAAERLIMVLQRSGFELRDSENTLSSLELDWATIIEHPHIFAVTAYRRKLVIERLIVELKLWKTEWIHPILEQKRNGNPMIQWLVEDRKLNQLYDHYRVFMSRFSIKYSPLLNRRWLALERTTKMRGERGFGRPGNACFQLTMYQADGVTIPFNIRAVNGSVRQITARNFKLFGDRAVVLHEFSTKSLQNQFSNDFVDALKVDGYSNGCVFVDDIPTKTQLCDVGRGVQFDDGTKGEISRVTVDQICIKIKMNAAGMTSFRWISKKEASKQLHLDFRDGNDLRNYYFAAVMEYRDEAIKASAVKTHQFTQIKNFSIPCGGIASYFAGFAVIGIYATPQFDKKYKWARIKTLKYSPNNKALLSPKSYSEDRSDEAKVNRLMMALMERENELGELEDVLRSLGLDPDPDTDSEWMTYIAQHPLLFAVTAYRRKLVIERFIVELELLSTELIHRILGQKIENKPMLRWLVEDRKVNQLYDHHRLYTSRFTVKYSALLNYRWLKYERNIKMLRGAGYRRFQNACFTLTDYMADDEPITPNVPAIKGSVRQITIENIDLFGYQPVVLHEFEKKHDGYIADDFADALCCDGEFVFLNHIPSASYQFCVGQEVQCNDGSIGTVGRVTAHGISVKFSRSGMISFRWFERENVPLELTLTFRYKAELVGYQFAVSRKRRNTRNLSGHEFSSISTFEISCKSLNLDDDDDKIYVFAKPKNGDFKWICIKTVELSSDSDLDGPMTARAVQNTGHRATVFPTAISIRRNMKTPLLSVNELSSNVFRFLSWLRQKDSKITDKTGILERFGLRKNQGSIWMSMVSDVPALCGFTAYRRMLLIERLIVELGLLSSEMMHHVIEQRKNGETVLQYLVINRKVRRLYDHYRVYTSGFKVAFRSDILQKTWLEFHKNTEKIGEDEWKESDNSCFAKTQYLIDGVVYPTDSSVCLADSNGIQKCRNKNLFGERDIQICAVQMGSNMQTSDFIEALNVDDGHTISVRPATNSKFGVDRNVELQTGHKWLNAMVSRETEDKICVKYSDGYMRSYRWIQRDDIPTKLRFVIKDRHKISEYTFAASVGTGDGVPLFFEEFEFQGDTELEIPLDKLVSSSSTPDTVHVYAKPKGKDFGFELIKRTELDLKAVPASTLAVDGKCYIDRKYTVQGAATSSEFGSKFKVFASSDVVIRKAGIVDVARRELNESDATKPYQQDGNAVIPKYKEFVDGDTKANGALILLISGGDIVNEGTVQCTSSTGGTIYINTRGVFENKGIIDCGENGCVYIKCAEYKNDGQITPNPMVIYKDKKVNWRAIERLIKQRDRKNIELKLVRHRGHDGSNHPDNLLEKGTEKRYECSDQAPPAKDWIIFRTLSNEPVFPKNIVIRNYAGLRGLKMVNIEGSTDGRRFVEWIQIKNISNKHQELQSFAVDPVSGCFAWDKGFVYFKINIAENNGGVFNGFYEFRMN